MRPMPGWLSELFARLGASNDLHVWYHPDYRLPLAHLEGATGLEPRRADFVAWYLVDRNIVTPDRIHTPAPVPFDLLDKVHTEEWLESVTTVETLARIFAASNDEVNVDTLLTCVRLACGGTVEGAEFAWKHGKSVLNLSGGFHHAGKGSGGGFCPVNDLACAVVRLRELGVRGSIAIIDLDAHPPDGTADCLADDPDVWIGSISGARWDPLVHVDETVLESGAGDAVYLAALDALLQRMPKPQFAFVLAGGDVLKGDRLGKLGMTLDGTRERDVRVLRALAGAPSVWVPAGGYTENTWRVLAGTALVLAGRPTARIRRRYDPLQRRFAAISAGLAGEELSAGPGGDDLLADLGFARAATSKGLGFYSSQGAEFALSKYGILHHVERLGYQKIRVLVDRSDSGDRMRVFGTADGVEHVLIEVVGERQRIGDRNLLYIHWMTLRHPRAKFSEQRPKLPGQDAPGLGLAREVSEMQRRIARRLGLEGLAARPSWFHMAYTMRARFRFADPARQGRFLAMVRDLAKTPLLDVTNAVAEGRVRLNGEPYAWEPDQMISLLDEPQPGGPEEDAELARCHFEIVPATDPAPVA